MILMVWVELVVDYMRGEGATCHINLLHHDGKGGGVWGEECLWGVYAFQNGNSR